MFDFQAFLKEQFNNPKGLTSFLCTYGAPLPQGAAVEKWFQRGSVPSGWFAILNAYLELDNGSPISLRKYIIHGGGDAA